MAIKAWFWNKLITFFANVQIISSPRSFTDVCSDYSGGTIGRP